MTNSSVAQLLLGSNFDAEHNLVKFLSSLGQRFEILSSSNVYLFKCWLGSEKMYLNQLVWVRDVRSIDFRVSISEIAQSQKQYRERARIPIDVDLICYGPENNENLIYTCSDNEWSICRAIKLAEQMFPRGIGITTVVKGESK